MLNCKRQLTLDFKPSASSKRRKTVHDSVFNKQNNWDIVSTNKLDIRTIMLYSPAKGFEILQNLEKEVDYLSGQLSQVLVYNKWHPIPRQHAAYGDDGITYTYSGVTVKAQLWTKTILSIKEDVEKITSHKYNFVLVNRYANGNDRMGFHRDDEKELDLTVPIASLSLGAPRDFVFKYHDKSANIANHSILLKSGMLLLMEKKSNKYWFHGLPQRKKCLDVRINLTFRKIKPC